MVESDDAKPTRTVFGMAWLATAVHGLVSFSARVSGSAAAAAPLNWDVLSLDFTFGVLCSLAISVMFFNSWRNGMVILLGVFAIPAVKVLLDGFSAVQRGGHPHVTPLVGPLVVVTLVVASCVACASSCGPRIARTNSPVAR